MGTYVTMLLLSIVSADNAEFIERSNQQLSEGYKWTYVGKQAPDGNPAITIDPQHSDEYILFKLQK
tara:strand:- start:1035 stop:1232 length:198 start_codon:yes stop_codon:yes gene_type:complete